MAITLVHVDDTETLKTSLALVRDVFWDFNAIDYTDEGTWEFDNYIELNNIAAEMRANRLLMWAAILKGQVIGVLAVRPPCHISLLFVGRRFQRRGVAKAMLSEMKRYFEQHIGCQGITVHSSPYAVPVYTRLGFAPTGEERTENGIRYTPMYAPP